MSYLGTLRELTLEHGPKVSRWPTEAQMAAALALYEHDEACERPDWMADALAEWVTARKWRELVLAALRSKDFETASVSALTALRAALRQYPQDWLQSRVDEHLPDWTAADLRQSIRDDRDSEFESRWLRAQA